eukprot:m.291950 g.291950  ORF g.291950 m.291950 type:complete len:197 (+) comp15831_c0_seq1:270-860(+)
MVSSVIAAAATGIGTLWVVNILGALLAIFPRRKDAAKSGLLTHNGLLVISKLSTLVLLPTLMGTSVAKTLDLEALQTAWPMLIWHVVATLLCVGIASVIAWVTGRPASIRKMFIVGSAFGNASDMALFVMSVRRSTVLSQASVTFDVYLYLLSCSIPRLVLSRTYSLLVHLIQNSHNLTLLLCAAQPNNDSSIIIH